MARIACDGVAEGVVSAKDLVRWGEALAAIARTGLGFTENLYERERFQEILLVAGEIRASASEALRLEGQPIVDGSDDSDFLVNEWLAGVGKGVSGYVTP